MEVENIIVEECLELKNIKYKTIQAVTLFK